MHKSYYFRVHLLDITTCFSLHVSVLKNQNKLQMDYIVREMGIKICNPEQTVENENVFVAEGPPFIPIETLVRRVAAVAESQERGIVRLRCYPTSSKRLLDSRYVQDVLLALGEPRKVDFAVWNRSFPNMDEESDM
jgi:hypothetical protein